MSRPYSTYSKKNNPWNKRRVDRNLTYDELSAEVNIPAGSLTGLFCGFRRPTEYELCQLCKFFDVDRDTGYLEFEHIYNSNHNNFPEPYVLYSAKAMKIAKNLKKEFCEEEAKVVDNGKVIAISADQFCRLIYGQIDFDDYIFVRYCVNKFQECNVVLSKLYQQLSYESYMKIIDVFYALSSQS